MILALIIISSLSLLVTIITLIAFLNLFVQLSSIFGSIGAVFTAIQEYQKSIEKIDPIQIKTALNKIIEGIEKK